VIVSAVRSQETFGGGNSKGLRDSPGVPSSSTCSFVIWRSRLTIGVQALPTFLHVQAVGPVYK
jgi:hypothetical protein